MATTKSLLCLLLLAPLALLAQPKTPIRTYAEALGAGDQAFKNQQYRQAIDLYFAAEAFDPGKKEEVKKRVGQVFTAIEKLRVQAQENEKKATDAQKSTAQALAETEKAKQSAQTSLAQANKLVNVFYFAYDRFGLAYGEKGQANTFYFIDKNGDPVTKLGEWEKAEQFADYIFGNGFAKVKKWESKNLVDYLQVDYLLDTLGQIYRVAYTLQDLGPETKALDLTGVQLDSFPTEVLAHPQLEVLILNGRYREKNRFPTLPAEINRLKQLKHLQLQNCQINSLPAAIGELKNLATLYLGFNRLTALPAAVRELKNLVALDLRNNQFTTLPKEIGEITRLVNLNLTQNQLDSLPAQIGLLQNLSQLSLWGNKLIALPNDIWQLQKLVTLLLGNNPLPVTEINKVAMLLPQLEKLNLNAMRLSSLPEAITRLKKLRTLDLSSDEFLHESYNQFSEAEREKIRRHLPGVKVIF